MADVDAKVKRAIAAYKAGKKSEARDILMEVVDSDEKNEQGWLYLSLVVDSKQEQQICLENVLAINPNNKQARKALEVLNKKLGVPPPPPPPPSGQASGKTTSLSAAAPSAPTEAETFASWGDIDVADNGGDVAESWGSLGISTSSASSSSPALDSPERPASTRDTGGASGWFDDMNSPWQADPNDPALSGGDFGSSASSDKADSKDPSYSYGRTTTDASNEFASDELDSWIKDMGIGQGDADNPQSSDLFGSFAPPAATPPSSGTSAGTSSGGAFDDLDWGNVDTGSGGGAFSGTGWDGSSSGAEGGTTADLGPGWGDIDTSSPGVFSDTTAPTTEETNTTTSKSEKAATPISITQPLSFDDDDDDDGPSIFPEYSGNLYDDDDDDEAQSLKSIIREDVNLDDIDDIDKSGAIRIDPAAMELFAEIPEGIEAPREGGGSGATVMLLLILNILAAGAAFFQFSNL